MFDDNCIATNGIEHFIAKSVDFGVSDGKDPVLQVPVTLGGEGIAYNLPGIARPITAIRYAEMDLDEE
jgi:ABC-type phosphate transport system substrate-binding protein